MPRLNCDDRGKNEFHYRLSNRTQQKKSTCIEGNFDEIIEKKARMNEIFQKLLIPIFIKNHTVQPGSFSTVGAFSTVATVLDES